MSGLRSGRLGRVRRALPVLLVVAAVAAAPGASVQAGANPGSLDAGLTGSQINAVSTTLLAKAEADECYDGIGNPYPAGPPCATGTPKTSGAYVWGMATTDRDVWFGTVNNYLCQVLGIVGSLLGSLPAHQTDAWVCEFDQSQLSPPLPGILGDWRAPQIFRYPLAGGSAIDMTPNDPLINQTVGIRSAGARGRLVLLAGPGLAGGINVFAFDGRTRNYLGSTNLPQFDNVRTWLLANGDLYVATGNTGGGGSVLRWTGSISSPFTFKVVGNLDTDGADMAFHEGRLFVSTWPRQTGPQVMAGLWMSPPIGTGLNPSQAGRWKRVWRATDYEPDPVTAMAYAGGALESFGGYLFFSTMHVPFLGAASHFLAYGDPTTQPATLAAIVGAQRSTALFRGSNFGGGSPTIELLYGEKMLPVYRPGTGWGVAPNAMGGVRPLFGSSGYGNWYAGYSWTMEVVGGSLYVGTMDYSYPFETGLGLIFDMVGVPRLPVPPELPGRTYGADLWRFDSATAPATLLSNDGLGNYLNYGIRTMAKAGGTLYLGTANPMNLAPEGGWELRALN